MNMPFGKYRGRPLDQIPASYLLWVLENCEKLSPTLRYAIQHQLGIKSAKQHAPPANRLSDIVPVWYRNLAREFHPDVRGSHDGMKAINRAKELLVEMAGGDA